jgi:hypothetical protein
MAGGGPNRLESVCVLEAQRSAQPTRVCLPLPLGQTKVWGTITCGCVEWVLCSNSRRSGRPNQLPEWTMSAPSDADMGRTIRASNRNQPQRGRGGPLPLIKQIAPLAGSVAMPDRSFGGRQGAHTGQEPEGGTPLSATPTRTRRRAHSVNRRAPGSEWEQETRPPGPCAQPAR